MNPLACTARVYDPLVRGMPLLMQLLQPSAPCSKPAAWSTPSGPRREDCAEREVSAIRDGACVLAIVAEARGGTREALLKKYARVQ